jgi:hypothetical protein
MAREWYDLTWDSHCRAIPGGQSQMTVAKMDFQVKGEDPVKKKLLFSIVCCFMAVLLIGTIPATAAGVEDIDAFVQEVWLEALPLNLSITIQ